MNVGKTVSISLLLSILFLGGGCRYLAARGKDFSDILSPGISSGAGIGIRIGATRLLAAEVMAQKNETFVGWNSRNFRWTESAYGLLFASWRMPSVERETPPERRWYDLFTTSRRRTSFPNRLQVEDRRYTFFLRSGGGGGRLIRILDLEVGASILFGGFELTLSPLEAVDFILGWFGLDIGRDDALGWRRPEGEGPPPDTSPAPAGPPKKS